jgi:hypothetical protein
VTLFARRRVAAQLVEEVQQKIRSHGSFESSAAGKPRAQELQGVFGFMKTKYGFHRRFDDDALEKVGMRSAVALALGRDALKHSAENQLV